MAIWVMNNSREDKKPEMFCPKLNHVSRKNSYLEKTLVFEAKFAPSHGHDSLKNKSYIFRINSHNQL